MLAVCSCLDMDFGSSLSIFFLRCYQPDDQHNLTNPSTTGSRELNSPSLSLYQLLCSFYIRQTVTKGYHPEHRLHCWRLLYIALLVLRFPFLAPVMPIVGHTSWVLQNDARCIPVVAPTCLRVTQVPSLLSHSSFSSFAQLCHIVTQRVLG